MAEETFTFQTEVGRLLDIVAHSLYTHKEIFLRELISNASDACDRLRHAALTESALTQGDPDFRIRLVVDRDAKTLAVIDNGVGMNRQDLIDTLGTIARSGTQAFLAQLSGDAKKDLGLIGQFGVGFYSAFMVAEKVEVVTRKAGEEHAWRWVSDGRGTFTIDEASRDGRGTSVILTIGEDNGEFLESHRLRTIVKTYSDHIGFPILLGEGEKAETLNAASSLWTRPKKEITEAQYTEFYHHVGHAFDDPWLVMHAQVEGVVSYTSLLFVPSTPPFDLFDPERRSKVKLYVRRVFITDNCEGLLPSYLRFLRGVVDSEDLPLNISRETFQHDPRLAKIRSGLIKRVLDDLAKKAKDEPASYEAFWQNFGALLKEGLYEDFESRDRILPLARFHSTTAPGLISLDAYVERMKPGQDAIYTLSGDRLETLRLSPQLEGFAAKGVEVLLLTDPIDEFWIPAVRSYREKPFRSAAGADADLSKVADAESESKPKPDAAETQQMERLLARLRQVLAEKVKDVRPSERLTESPVCLVAAVGDMDMHLERLLRQHRHLGAETGALRILEVNPRHPLIRQLAHLAGQEGAEGTSPASGGNGVLADAALLLLDQARIMEGEPPLEPAAFARRLATALARGLITPLPGDAQG
jgi:molecular chaperone HtpG